MIGSVIEKELLYNRESFNESLLRETLLDHKSLQGLGINFASDSDASWSTSPGSPPIEELWKSLDALIVEDESLDSLDKSASFDSNNSDLKSYSTDWSIGQVGVQDVSKYSYGERSMHAQKYYPEVPTFQKSNSVPVCTFFLQGYCARGNTCKYAHILNPEMMDKRLAADAHSSRLPYFAEMRSSGVIASHQKIKEITRQAHHFLNADVLDFSGHLLVLCKDQQGCRFLQRKLDEQKSGDAELLFNEVSTNFPELMIDPFGNYLCQKMLDYSNQDQKTQILKLVSPHLISICKNVHGTRAAQKLCEVVSSTDLIHQVIEALSREVINLIMDLNGNHVIQKCLIYFNPEHNQFIYDSVASNVILVATHRHGCCVIQRCIDSANVNQRTNLILEIISHSLKLVQNPFGNYVIQYILDLNESTFITAIIETFSDNICFLSMQKFSSNVVEKCIRVGDQKSRDMIISELLNKNLLESLLRDSYANYVIQTCLDYAASAHKDWTGRVLGEGSFATVKEAEHIKTGQKFAVKVINKKLMQGKEKDIINEIEILKKVSNGHPNIIHLQDYFETPNNLYLVMDLCTGGELFDRIAARGSFYEEDAAGIVKTILEIVRFLHSQGIVHRDIKPENILLRSKASFDIVLSDFGLSKLINTDSLLKTTCGTPGYMAPEILSKKGHGKPVDLWAVGVLCYFLLSGMMPFETADNNSVKEMKNIMQGKYDFEDKEWEYVSDQAKDFISSLLIIDPERRLTADQALDHEWFHILDRFPVSTTIESPIYNTPISPNPPNKDLFSNVKEGLSARKVFAKAVDVVKAVNKLAAGISKSHIHLGTKEADSPAPGTSKNSAIDLYDGDLTSSTAKLKLSKSQSNIASE